ncbi:TetR/AcrR family transcriptional regulator [Paenibacillus kribbensis]|uniref:TetR/AcrR family transcriptional regulator n=1 Tax=Paenibacillus kribbensis TaxID=172713 RepID=UPI000837CEE2|nr:TetR/AcrR family transcriptional regulator [Paenibacillus kribbensis]
MDQKQKTKKMTSRDLQAAERKKQILKIAKQLFADKGYHATSMRELNKAIGMTEALTYHYFPGGKLEILRAVLQNAQEERISNFVAFFKASFSQNESLKTILTHLMQGFSERIILDKEYFQILIRDRNLLEQEDKETLDTLTRLPFEAMAAFLAGQHERGEIRSLDFEIAASQFLSHTVVLIVRQMLDGRTLEVETINDITDFYVRLWST